MNDRERFDGRDALFVILCLVVLVTGLAIGLHYFRTAFPEASIRFDDDREASRDRARELLREINVDFAGMYVTTSFDGDETARVFLERSLGLDESAAATARGVEVWYWSHRWFRPGDPREVSVAISPSGTLVSLRHHMPETVERSDRGENDARNRAEGFLRRMSAHYASLDFVSISEIRLPGRVERTFTWTDPSRSLAGAHWREEVIVTGSEIVGYHSYLDVPERWVRDYRQLRSKNHATAAIDSVLLGLTLFAALVVFVLRLRRGDLQVRFATTIGITGAVLVAGVALNGFPAEFANFDTNETMVSFLTRFLLLSVLLPAAVAGVLLMVVTGSGEALYRERFPAFLAIPRVFRFEALQTREGFRGLLLGYTLFAAFFAYQTVFYLVAGRYGAWAPADVPYSEVLNTAVPWIAVLFIGFFPAVSEEFLSRAFSIPLFERLFRSPAAAVIVAGMIWGFGHAAYPNQPFWIRGAEVGLAGIVIGILLFRFGLIPLLIWHYTVDALYTALLLLRSDNLYYVVSAGFASLLFVIPLLASIGSVIRNRGFLRTDSMRNADVGTAPDPAAVTLPPLGEAPRFAPPSRGSIIAGLIALAAVAGAIVAVPHLPSDSLAFPIGEGEAKSVATSFLKDNGVAEFPARVAVVASTGFNDWNSEAPEGGQPGGFNAIAAERIVSSGGIDELRKTARDRIPGSVWLVRWFDVERKRELRAAVDPRRRTVVGWTELTEEDEAGERLGRAEAERLARAAAGGDDEIRLKEAISIPRPQRLDWLFHFERGAPVAGGVTERVHVRVTGNRVTHHVVTAHLPEEVVRAEERRHSITVVLGVAQIAAIGFLLFLAASGLFIAARDHGYRWRRALRIAPWFGAAGVLLIPTRLDELLWGYDTATAWTTYLLLAVTQEAVTSALIPSAAAFAAIYVLETTSPHSLVPRRSERIAPLAALAAAGLMLLPSAIERIVWRFAPALLDFGVPSPPSWAGNPMSAASLLYRSALILLLAAALASSLSKAIAELERRRKLVVIGSGLTALALVLANPSGDPVEVGVELILAIARASALWIAAAYLLRRSVAAWIGATMLILVVPDALSMISLGYDTARLNGIAVLVVAAGLLLHPLTAARKGAP